MYLAHKLLPVLLSPIGLAIMACLLSAALRSRAWALGAAALLWLTGMPIVSHHAKVWLEAGAEPTAIETLPELGHVIVLGGLTTVALSSQGVEIVGADGDAERFDAGVEIFESGKAEFLVFTRGASPWTGGLTEGDYLKDRALARGVPEERILLTARAATTEDEARAVADMALGEVALVTSAYHMPRAERVFRYYGVDIVPVSVDFRADPEPFSILSVVPSAIAFEETSLAIREAIGRLYYRIKYPL